MKTLLERIEEAENNLKELKELALKDPKKEVDFSILNDKDVFYMNASDIHFKYNCIFKGKNPFNEKVKIYNLLENKSSKNVICDKDEVIELRLATQEETELFYKHFPEEKDNFPKTWEGLGEIHGWFFRKSLEISEICDDFVPTKYDNMLITPTKKEAISYLAACKLRQLAKVINDNQTEDEWVYWNDELQVKYYPTYCHISKKFSIIGSWVIEKNSIYFKRNKDLERSLIEHKDLWLTYFKVSNNV